MAASVIPNQMFGEIVPWGDNTYSQVSDDHSGHDYTEIFPGGNAQSLAIHKNGSLKQWGGVGVRNPVPDPLWSGPLPGIGGRQAGGPFVTASIGLSHGIAIRVDGTSFDWGKYADGSAVVSGKGRYGAVAAAGIFDVVIDLNGNLQTWGVMRQPPKGKFKRVGARNDYAIAIHEDGRLFGWGGVFDKPLPSAGWEGWASDADGYFYVEGPFIDLAAGNLQKDLAIEMPHVLAIHEGGKVEGWGADTFGETTDIPPGVRFKEVAAGSGFSVGLDEDGFLYHWGNSWGGIILSGGTYGLNKVPKGRFISVSAGSHHAAAVRRNRVSITAGPEPRGPGLEHLSREPQFTK